MSDKDKEGLVFEARPPIPMADDDISMEDLALAFDAVIRIELPPDGYVEVARVRKLQESEIPPPLVAAGYAHCMVELTMTVPPIFRNPPPLVLDQVIDHTRGETSKLMHEMFLSPFLEAFRRDRKSDHVYVRAVDEERVNSDVVFYMTKMD